MSSAADLKSLWAEEAVGGDLACAGCGYNLRSLKQGQLCPECGEPVTMSLVMFHFRGAGRPAQITSEWVRELLEGSIVLLFGLILGFVLCMALSGERVLNSSAIQVFFYGQSVAWCLTFAGIWKLTRAPETGDHNAYDAFWRQSLRVAASFYASGPVLFAAAGGGAAFDIWLELVLLLYALLGIAASFCLYQHLRQLARRLRSIAFQVVMCILSLISPWFLAGLLASHRGSSGEYVMTVLLLLPSASLAPPEAIGRAAANVMMTLTQETSLRPESLLFLFPVGVMAVFVCFGVWLAVRYRLMRRNDISESGGGGSSQPSDADASGR